MTKVSTVITFAAAAAVASVNASYVLRLGNEDSGSGDFDLVDGSGDGSSSIEGLFVDELPSEVAEAIPKYGQCGGIGYVGNSQCAQGYVCVLSDPWYAQCLPKGSQTSVQAKKRSHRFKVLPDSADLLVEDVSNKADGVAVVPAWEQCGGKGVDFDFYKDDSTLDDDSLADDETPMKPCEEGYTCEVINKWYYQCKPLTDLTGINLWEQCGGEDYKGPTECTTGSVCKYFNDWYSQCVPKEQEFS
ncbi:hypothetical protein PHYPSEUDO_007171 [Phytophthora pseudosyringae]|uniref:CBM1 domain-containing protein n=1 Tax=Phytophthora pseudosyringae TaxID=221518 RepID=A0A8T1VJS9_9STRA|nr:hypothetical protein PHYPSEUDO_007171 [Phytophthora pseudosyringae]